MRFPTFSLILFVFPEVRNLNFSISPSSTIPKNKSLLRMKLHHQQTQTNSKFYTCSACFFCYNFVTFVVICHHSFNTKQPHTVTKDEKKTPKYSVIAFWSQGRTWTQSLSIYFHPLSLQKNGLCDMSCLSPCFCVGLMITVTTAT